MISTVFYRMSAVFLLLFGVLHTIGFLTFKPPTQEGLAVLNSMTNVHFQVNGADLSYGNFYKGFGLIVTIFFLFSAIVAWYLAKNQDRAIGWSLVATQIACLPLAWMYFTITQVAFGVLLVAFLICAVRFSSAGTVSLEGFQQSSESPS